MDASSAIGETRVLPRVMTNQPPPETIYASSDAAWREDMNLAGTCWIFMNKGTITDQGSKAVHHVPSPLIGEALALRSALNHAIQLGIQNLAMRSDSLDLINSINSDKKIKELHGILQDVKTLSARFNFVSFSHIFVVIIV
ncbi:uncharacterized protein LOC112082080 [Eutrema salsugineum]|uniref:uncharacterized protein LOC112082080 n=1 Tax=Eutrema salsugineum TaxID=72664 RepID=UPI000CED2A42|nr:uncharacterized protein LOC112082080 [Eutrema salsugineum]